MITDFIGNTPIVRLNGFEKANKIKANIYAKLEYLNPFGSIKDRAAYRIICDAEREGLLNKNMEIIEASSGNMGIAVAAISSLKGYKCTIIMPQNMSEKRKQLIRSYGADLILTKAEDGISGSVNMLENLKTKYSFFTRQFDNYSNLRAHYYSTAPEIEKSLRGKVDMIICGIGSGGTASGLNSYFKNTEIRGVLPLSQNDNIAGIGAGFIPKILDKSIYDNALLVSSLDAERERDELIKTDGIFVGYSSGAVLSAVNQLCKTQEYINKNIVLIFADSGERYL